MMACFFKFNLVRRKGDFWLHSIM